MSTPIVRITSFSTAVASLTYRTPKAAQSPASSPTSYLNTPQIQYRTPLRLPNQKRRHLFQLPHHRQGISPPSQTTHPYRHYLRHIQAFVMICGGYLRQLLGLTLHSNNRITSNEIIGPSEDTEVVDVAIIIGAGEAAEMPLHGLQKEEKTKRCPCSGL